MSYQDVIILNPWDSQGNQIADSAGIYPTIRGCGGGISKDTYFIERKMRMTYQKVTVTLMANSHPGSYCGQDAYNNMLVTENELLHRKRSSRPTTSANESRSIELYARSASSYEGGGTTWILRFVG